MRSGSSLTAADSLITLRSPYIADCGYLRTCTYLA
ncbi:Protein of unknown function [Pyronema omphalodes CBS 100304]|uniref:Uncharacterized protein n=1 Tax=Pyronema omphalodes (strain CBS 100304) TaxID=1076935 RepID=U4LWY8_PYROM|nr:Protein of unknown function [Pyronema omphalodes CBS 100304]